jgi:hypothetical protein
LLVLATFTAFFVAQRLKHTDPLVYSVNVKRYVSPNDDNVRDRARLRFRTKKQDVVTVEVIDRTGTTVRTLAEDRSMEAGPHRFQWNGRTAARGDKQGVPVPDGAYRVRITMRDNGRTFVPDKYFVVDTTPPTLIANVEGGHTRSILQEREPVKVAFTGVEASKRIEFLVYRVRGQRTLTKPLAVFRNEPGKPYGEWDQTIGEFTERQKDQCFGAFKTKGRPRPAPVASYVIIARACDAAGNQGESTSVTPPRAGTTRGLSGVTLTGVQLAPNLRTATAGTLTSFRVDPPSGGYTYRLTQVGGATVARGKARGRTLRVDIPNDLSGLFTLRITARDPVRGDRGVATAPVAIHDRHGNKLLLVQPTISWQTQNPVDVTGDGFGDPYTSLPAGQQLRIGTDRFLALQAGTPGFDTHEGSFAAYLETAHTALAASTTTDFDLANADADALGKYDSIFFAGDERWITPQLGVALRAFVQRGGKVAFFAPDAFRRTVRLTTGEINGPSDHRQRDIFGESVEQVNEAPAPVIPFQDELGLLRGPTGLFEDFEQTRQLAKGATVLTSAGREAKNPALIGYSLGKGEVIRIGLNAWQAELRGTAEPNVAWTTDAILAELAK